MASEGAGETRRRSSRSHLVLPVQCRPASTSRLHFNHQLSSDSVDVAWRSRRRRSTESRTYRPWANSRVAFSDSASELEPGPRLRRCRARYRNAGSRSRLSTRQPRMLLGLRLGRRLSGIGPARQFPPDSEGNVADRPPGGRRDLHAHRARLRQTRTSARGHPHEGFQGLCQGSRGPVRQPRHLVAAVQEGGVQYRCMRGPDQEPREGLVQVPSSRPA